MSLFERLVREVHAERQRQDEKWGVQNHPMTLDDTLHGSDWWRGLADIWKRENDFRVQRGTQRGLPKDRNCAWDGIFIEEIAETFAEERPGLQYAEAVQAAGVAFAILDFLNRQSMELRGHYAGCPALDVDGLVHAPEACDCEEQDEDSVTEYATAFKGGDMQVFVDEPEVEAVYPMAKRIASEQRFGGKVYQRVIKLVEGWKEVAS